jgi:hypothetical protein
MGKAVSETAADPPSYVDAEGRGGAVRASPEELDGLTLYEKKCVLINHEMDSNGMGESDTHVTIICSPLIIAYITGRYQWYIWGLCGFGYLLDLLWAQAFGLVLSPLEQELGFPGNQSGNISVGTLARAEICHNSLAC